ncbi:MAG: Molybdopterin molybdenumtransferase [uncultured Thermomicrobiales bacterium]|uniref:Molybdopterin molybdenumtransferase n=1 Tax=uncultured Thermomicrobiales bacterium TaxID=1645740 RepID=A0A6J4VIP1_9BACT|nr:MAG: Molybdopterin molybdenumtransferase [uncultured Thermomicrobiales bacterium]
MTSGGGDEGMIDVDAARGAILAGIAPLPAVETPILDALGLILAEEIVAAEDIPPFRNSAMDGYAVRAADLAGASHTTPTRLRVVAEGPAGYAPRGAVTPGTAIRIMTGAPLPPGADTVVRFEETDEPTRGMASSSARAPGEVCIGIAQDRWVNVREAGEDIRAGTTALPPGVPLRPAEIGVLASLGRATVRVHRHPVVAIVSTGDEVVALGGTPRPGQIRDSNSHTLAALVRRYGGIPRPLGVARDTVADLTTTLAAARDADLIISSGGVSVGDYDMVKDVLRAEGQIAIWQVRMKPGKPLAYGRLDGVPFLGLPGNPVAAYVSFELFARPILLRQLGHATLDKPTVRARVTAPVPNGGGRHHFVRALVTAGPNGPEVRPTGDQGSGILTALTRANGLLVIPGDNEGLGVGDMADVILLHREQGSEIPRANQ